MEKGYFSVEWLSQSSHRTITLEATTEAANSSTTTTTTPPNVDLLRFQMGQAFPYEKEYNTSLPSEMEKTNAGTDFNEKENHIDNQIALYQAPSTLRDSHGLSISRNTFQEVSAQSPVQEKSPFSDSDSMKSPGSVSEDESKSTSRPRTKFTTEQLEELERSFKENQYIGSNEKQRLSKVLQLSKTQIKTWFQNRRMKFKRESHNARLDLVYGICLPCYNYSDFQPPPNFSLQPNLPIPLAHPTPVHPFRALPTAVVRPPLHSAPITPPNFGSFPCPPVLVHPMLNDPMSHTLNPY
ncbi:homeobox protein vex1-like [Phyllobates terribilis]|uniref:homeobox protein vex1-like n=1 Tax=Phyllobates terribilis TaxID=111132 RepID=UPI003CCAB255